ncbi:hypothetical protein AWJ14_15010 [Hoeflea olei]|uniref:Uncharacterized protein n=2 Tax=Hoeflea olei TaxID=1480615 RepID=A0A1C1YQK9_9HYPH|nr:hypothetical protein AWJ14_15010 [Hoeflea olei]
MSLFGRAKFPYPSNRHHAEILDDASIIAHLQRVLEDAAYDVALLGDQPFDTEIENREQWLDAARQASSLPLDRMAPEVYAGLISFLSSKAQPVGISGLDIYRGAKAYEGSDANNYRAVAYALASEVGTGLNDISKAWANQNAAISLLKVGNQPLAAATAIRTGEVTAQFVNQPNTTYEKKYLKEFSNVEQGWKSIISSTLSSDENSMARDIIAESQNYDTSIFNGGALEGYATLPTNILGVPGNGT